MSAYTFFYYVSEAWNLWCLPFSLIPYGDPYLAALTLFSICFYTVWRKAFGQMDAL